jgi:hypothetical protein
MRLTLSRPVIAIGIILVTVMVCFVGIRTELRQANRSVREHSFRTVPRGSSDPALVAAGEGRIADPTPP